MRETLQQRPQDRRFQLGPMHIAFLLVLPAVGLGLLAGMRERAAERSEPRLSGSEGGNRSQPVEARTLSPRKILAHPDWIPSHDHPLLGQQAPDFALADPDGKVWNLRELRADSLLVLIFYYGYHCPNCVRQLRYVNKDLPLFREVGARVIAISADPAELTRRRFEQYGRFDFVVLSDPGNKVAHAYQALRGDLLRHGTFLIDRHGIVSWVNVGDAPFRCNAALLSQLAKMEGHLANRLTDDTEPRP